MRNLRLRHLAAVAVIMAACAQPAAAGDYYGHRRHHGYGHHHHQHGVNVFYGTPDYALPEESYEASVVSTLGRPTVVYGPAIFPDPMEIGPVYLVDQAPTGTYPLGEYRDPATFRSPLAYPYVGAGYVAYSYERRHRHRHFGRRSELFNDFR